VTEWPFSAATSPSRGAQRTAPGEEANCAQLLHVAAATNGGRPWASSQCKWAGQCIKWWDWPLARESAHAWATPCCLFLGQRLRRSRVCGHLGLLSPALVVPGRVCCVHVDLCVFVCGVIYARVLETLWMVLTATCNFAFPLFLTTPFKPFECTATFAINRFYHYVVFFTAGDCGLLLPPTAYLLCVRGIHYLSECTVCCDGLRAGRGKSGSQFSWKFV